MRSGSIFSTFFQAGFECSTHRLKNGRRLDLVESTGHDRLMRADYLSLKPLGIRTVREGIRWHRVESAPRKFDFDTVRTLIDIGLETETEQIIDLLHFGWPDHLDVFKAEFVDAFAVLTEGFCRTARSAGLLDPFVAPCNEMSFMAWAGGDVEYVNPFQRGRGDELKEQLVRASLAAVRVLRTELPMARLVWPEPVIHIAGDPGKPGDEAEAEAYRLSMFQVWDMISGRFRPELGGSPEFLQIIGVNFYDRNEWMNHGRTLSPGESEYRPFHQILAEVWKRYRKPLFVSETGTEDEKRPAWFRYISEEVREAMALGVPVHGICLYPVLNHPGWDDDRHCYNGLFDYAEPDGRREIYEPLAAEIRTQQQLQLEFDLKQEHV